MSYTIQISLIMLDVLYIVDMYFLVSVFITSSFLIDKQGFRKVDPDRWEFAHEGFLKGQKQLLKTINRRKSSHANGSSQQPSKVQNSPVGACVEVGKFGLEEEVERLKRDKNVLMQELVRLRQQQQTTDNQLQSVGQRMQVMEQRQQQMMSFLAKAMHSPSFLAQFVQQKNESNTNRHITGGKKRRFHRQEEDRLATKHVHNPLDGRVVKYQPSINEAAKALLRQLSQMNNSTRMESSIKNPDAFFIDDAPSAMALDSSSSSTQVSGVTLSEVPPISGQSCMAVESQFPVSCMTNSISEVQSAPAVLTDCIKAAEFPELTAHNCQNNVLDFGKVRGMGTESSFMNSDQNFVGSNTGNEEIDVMSTVLDGTESLKADAFSPDADGISKLPGINDEFWELFLRPSPLTGDTDEVKCTSLGYGLTKDQELSLEKEIQQEKMDKKQHIDHLTQQMELLASES